MHGRLKVRTTEEQEKLKKLERAQKVEMYRKNMTILSDMRKSGCYEKNALDIINCVLLKIPDINTLWNYRREIFLHMKEVLEEGEFQKLLEEDLNLTEQCLRVNPKSYGSWHHRMWILCNLPQPNWEKELLLCKKYLELDERNFHCWDYRRFVAQMANVSDLAEYEYTLEKIKANFSNYSAWHLRSKLLPKIFPDTRNILPISEEKHKEELELVQNAAFTDPQDQSAWFYQRWLLGLTDSKTHFISAQAVDNLITVGLSKSIAQGNSSKCGPYIEVKINNEEVAGIWRSVSGAPQSTVWILKLDAKVLETDEVVMCLKENGTTNDSIQLTKLIYQNVKPNFEGAFSSCLQEVLADELSSCEQLLELEPDSKWTTLTSVLLMEVLDATTYRAEIENRLMKLTETDPLRSGYYRDLHSKFVTQHAITCYYSQLNHNNLMGTALPKFVLNGKNLTSLYHMQYLLLIEDVDLSSNSITSKCLSSLYCLLNCKRLNLDNNKITTLRFLPVLKNLCYISVCNNPIEDSSIEHVENFNSSLEVRH